MDVRKLKGGPKVTADRTKASKTIPSVKARDTSTRRPYTDSKAITGLRAASLATAQTK